MQFFIISGFLFWRKLMAKDRIELGTFYLSRFIRLAPAYYLCVGAAILIGLSLTQFQIRVSARELMMSLASWMLFSLGGQQASVNGVDVSRILSGVVWTLVMEWCFYLSLPFLRWFSHRAQRLIHLVVLCGCVLPASI